MNIDEIATFLLALQELGVWIELIKEAGPLPTTRADAHTYRIEIRGAGQFASSGWCEKPGDALRGALGQLAAQHRDLAADQTRTAEKLEALRDDAAAEKGSTPEVMP